MMKFLVKIALFTEVLPTIVSTALSQNYFLHAKGKVGTFRARSKPTSMHT